MGAKKRILIASSWKNDHHARTVRVLQKLGHEVYDFTNGSAIHWTDIDPNWKNWGADDYAEAASTSEVLEVLNEIHNALIWCDTCVYVAPAGRSAAVQLGYCLGTKRDCYVYYPNGAAAQGPELLFMGNIVTINGHDDLLRWFGPEQEGPIRPTKPTDNRL